MTKFITKSFHSMFYPRAVAVVGASTHPAKTGNFVLRAALASKVEKVYPVNASGAGNVMGLQAYRSIEDIPDQNVDLFLFAVPQQSVLQGIKSAIAKGCRAAVIYTSGFREAGPGGERLQEDLKDMADAAGINIIGPNTMGFFRADSFLNATFIPVFSEIFTEPGDISVVSQSGGVGGVIANQFIEQHLSLGTLVCLGNRVNVEFADMLDYFSDDPKTSAVALFIEGVDDLGRFYHSARRCALKKPVVVLAAGNTADGRKIARSHTGSMATSAEIYRAAFKQAGLLEVNSVQELVDTMKIIRLNPMPEGNRLAIITHTAGPSILASDVLGRGGLKLADLSPETKTAIQAAKVLPDFMPVDNPVDLAAFGFTEHHRYLTTLKSLLADRNVDCTLSLCMSPMGDPNIGKFPVEEYKKLVRASNKPAAFAWLAPANHHEEFRLWSRAGIPAYPTSERAAGALVNLLRHAGIRPKTGDAGGFAGFGDELCAYTDRLVNTGRDFLLENEAKDLLELAGIATARARLADNEDHAVKLAEDTGYPVALKVASDKISHKSDVGGVALNLKSAGEVRHAYNSIVKAAESQFACAGLRGVTVQPMLPEGIEVIIGGIRDTTAGPVVMFGLGGIWVEVLRDVTFRLAPVNPGEALDMIREIRGYQVIKGIRGKNAVSEDILADLIVRVSQLINLFPIREIDLNPVIFYGERQYAAADARITLLKG